MSGRDVARATTVIPRIQGLSPDARERPRAPAPGRDHRTPNTSQRRRARTSILRPKIPSDGPRDGTGRHERSRAVAPGPARSGDDLREPPRLGGAADLHPDPAAPAHGPAPEGVSVGGADRHGGGRAPAGA